MIKYFSILISMFFSFVSYSQGTKRMVTNYSGKITSLKGINTEYDDFSATVIKNEIYFASSREPSIINFKENNWKKGGKINVYRADIEEINDFYEVKALNTKPFYHLKDEFTHVGPTCFSVTGDTMFFTKVPTKLLDKSLKVFRPQLYMLTKQNGKWSKAAYTLPFNNPLYSYAHPSFDSKTGTLYFTSDQKGGKGGQDIYSATITNGKWSKPINCKSVNSKSDELFPFIDNENTLFFSSDRSNGQGGLDIYYLEEKSADPQNMSFINSETDDFGIFLVAGTNIGFFSSNRTGNDDIYTVSLSKERDLKNSLFGKFKYRKLQEAIERPLAVYLLNEQNQPIQETFVDENGEFEFFDIGLDENYTIQAESKDEMDLVLYNGEGSPEEKLLANESNQFIFKMVDIKDVGDINLTQVNEQGEVSVSGRFLFEDDQFENPGKLTVNLIDSEGKIAHTVQSDEKGYFNFQNLPNNENYIVKLEEENPDLTLLVFNEDGKVIEKLKTDENGFYLFRQLKVLSIDKVNRLSSLREEAFSFDSGLINGDFDRDNKDVDFKEELIVSVYNDKNELINTIRSDKKGAFKYKRMATIENVSFKLDQMSSSFDMEGVTLKIFDDNGHILKEIIPKADGSYEYRALEILNIQALQAGKSIDEGDFDLTSTDKNTDFAGFILGDFDRNSNDVEFKENLIVSVYNENNELIDTIISNSKGVFTYENVDGIENLDFQLDQMPTSFDMTGITLKIMDDKGNLIKEIKPQADGSFEYRSLEILNIQALQAINSMDEGDFDLGMTGVGNEELEGSIKYNNQVGNFPGGLEVKVFNKDNKLQETRRTDTNGNFKFIDNPSADEFSFEISEKPDSLKMSLFSIDIKSKEGENLSTILPSVDGQFNYRKLEVIDNSSNLANLDKIDESIDLIFEIKGNYDYNNKEGNFEEKLKIFAYDGNGNKIGEVFSDRFGNFVFEKLPGISTVLFKIEGKSEDLDLEKFSLYIEGEEGKQLAKLRSSEKGFFVYKPLGFNADIPLEIKEKMNDEIAHSVFGTNALDLSNEIESVYFGSNKTNPNSSDLLKVEKMLLLLEINPKSTIEINAYADSRASDNYNLLLSERRADWIKNYLVRKGVSETRVIINAYGEGKLVNDCKDGVDCPDKYHALNRRAEIRIIN